MSLPHDAGVHAALTAGTAPTPVYRRVDHAIGHLDETFLLGNADSLFGFNLLDLARPPTDARWLGKLALRIQG